MYGIRLNKSVLCTNRLGHYIFMPIHMASRPILKSSQIDIDVLLQEMILDMEDYALVVHEFSEEELEVFLINKLKGY